MEEHKSPKLYGSTKAFLAVIIIIAIVVPVILGVALVKGLPYTLPAKTGGGQTSTTSTGGTGTTVTLPQGAGGAAQLNFSPATLSVASGTTITFVDQDNDAPHNIYFTSIPSGVSITTNPSSILTQGKSYTVTLTTPGVYKFECQFHTTWMQGTITVSG